MLHTTYIMKPEWIIKYEAHIHFILQHQIYIVLFVVFWQKLMMQSMSLMKFGMARSGLLLKKELSKIRRQQRIQNYKVCYFTVEYIYYLH